MKIDKRRALWIGAGLAVVILLALIAKTMFFPSGQPKYVTARAALGDIEQDVLATGSLEPVRLVSVGSQASGQVIALHYGLGDTVHKGDLIAQIDPATQHNTLLTAQASLRNYIAQRTEAQANLTEAEIVYRRQAQLAAQDSTSRADYDQAKATYEADKAKLAEAEAQIASAKVSVNTAQVDLGYTRIVAPMDGTVVAVVTKQGQTVNAAQSTPTIVKLGQLTTMTVKAQISEADVVKVRPGQPVYFTILGEPDRKYSATLQSIEPAPYQITDYDSIISSSSSSSTAIYYSGHFDVPNAEGRLRTFMTAQVTIVANKAVDAVIVPASALGPKLPDGRYVVRVLRADGKDEPRLVRVGIDTDASAQIVSGLRAGETVITGGGPQAGGKPPGPPRNGPSLFGGPPGGGGGPPGGGPGL